MRPVNWIGSSYRDVKSFGSDVRSEIGFALYLAQKGEKAANAVPMVGFGSAKVLEVLVDDDGDTYRAIYTVKFAKAVYVLHAFQKKSKRGIATPMHELDVVKQRLKTAEIHYKANYEQNNRKRQSNERGA